VITPSDDQAAHLPRDGDPHVRDPHDGDPHVRDPHVREPRDGDPHPATAHLVAATASGLADDLAAGRTTSVELTQALIDRIAAIDDAPPVELRSVLALSADALDQAARLDAERAAGTTRGPLHGIPVLVKDNVEVVGLPGTAGSLALAGRVVERDAPLVAAMRTAGLVILGATNLSEWANMRSPHSTSGWSALGGLVGNPWALDRSAGGSSSGSGAAVAAGLAPLAVGSETDGSITCPSSLNGVTGLKPTVGLVSTEGMVPLAASQDAPGPMGRRVRDVALLLDAMTGSHEYAEAPGSRSLDGLRLGVARGWLSRHAGTDEHFEDVLTLLAGGGAHVAVVEVEPVGAAGPNELDVLLCERKDGLDRYLAARPGDGPRSLADVIAFNTEHADLELAHFGHEFLVRAEATDGIHDDAYAPARAACLQWAVDSVLAPAFAHASAPDVLIAPAYAPAWKSDLRTGDRFTGGGFASGAPSMAGWPVLCLPMGLVAGLPVGLVLVGRPHSESVLLAAGQAIEDALDVVSTLHPTFVPAARG
jgi:amidase